MIKNRFILLLSSLLLVSCTDETCNINLESNKSLTTSDNLTTDNLSSETESVENQAISCITETFCNSKCKNYRTISQVNTITTKINSMLFVVLNSDTYNYHYHIIVNYEKGEIEE